MDEPVDLIPAKGRAGAHLVEDVCPRCRVRFSRLQRKRSRYCSAECRALGRRTVTNTEYGLCYPQIRAVYRATLARLRAAHRRP